MVVYLAVWGIMMALLYIANARIFILEDKARRALIILVGIIYICFAVFRETTVNQKVDVYHYNVFFNRASMPLKAYLATSTLEVGYTLLEWILYRIFGDFKTMLFLVHTLVYVSTIKLMKESNIRRRLFVWLGCLTLDMFTAFYLLRNTIAISIGIYVFLSLKEKRYIKAVLLSAIAILMHNASVILLFLCAVNYLFDNRSKFSKEKLVFFGGMSVLGVYVFTPLLVNLVTTDTKYYVYADFGIIGVRFYSTAFIVWLFSIMQLQKKSDADALFKIATISLTGIFILIPLQMSLAIVYRMTLFFQPIVYFLMIKLLDSYRKRQISYWLIRAVGFMTFGVNLYTFITKTLGYIGNPYIWAGFNG